TLRTSAVSSAISRSSVASSSAVSCSICIVSIDSNLSSASFSCFRSSLFSLCWGWYLACSFSIMDWNLSRSP
ncbi:hypothetical protein CH063_10716, partial [Colletotrichum higginsianum]